MFDDLDRLRNNPSLFGLLRHYASLGEVDRETWQDRLMAMDDLEPIRMVKLHGELIAFRWIEQNTGQVPILKVGMVPGCYRVTYQGQRVLRQIQGTEVGEETIEDQDNPISKRWKKRAA